MCYLCRYESPQSTWMCVWRKLETCTASSRVQQRQCAQQRAAQLWHVTGEETPHASNHIICPAECWHSCTLSTTERTCYFIALVLSVNLCALPTWKLKVKVFIICKHVEIKCNSVRIPTKTIEVWTWNIYRAVKCFWCSAEGCNKSLSSFFLSAF